MTAAPPTNGNGGYDRMKENVGAVVSSLLTLTVVWAAMVRPVERELDQIRAMFSDQIQREVERNNRIEHSMGGVDFFHEMYLRGMVTGVKP